MGNDTVLRDYIPFFVALVFGVVGFVFFLFIKRARTRLPIEQGQKPLHEEYCGAILNNRKYSLPFVRFALYENFLVISYFGKILLPLESIEVIRIRRRHLLPGLQIVHHQPDAPRDLFVWLSRMDRVRSLLEGRVSLDEVK